MKILCTERRVIAESLDEYLNETLIFQHGTVFTMYVLIKNNVSLHT